MKFQHIPYVASLDLNITNIDVFCEEGVYNPDQSRRMCEAGKVSRLTIWLFSSMKVNVELYHVNDN